jgi:hypothetical protein
MKSQMSSFGSNSEVQVRSCLNSGRAATAATHLFGVSSGLTQRSKYHTRL